MPINLNKSTGEDMYLSPQSPTYIFGTGSFGKDVAKALAASGFNVLGFISNKEKSSRINQLKVYQWEELGDLANAQILIAILNPNDALSLFTAQAKACGAENIFMPWDFYGYIEKDMGWRFWLKDKNFLCGHQQHLNDVLPYLSDGKSRDCLSNVFKFRTGNFLNYSHFNHEECHYFNQLTLASKKEIAGYLDIGAYHGENLLELETYLPVHMAMLFEPDKQNFQEIIKNDKSFTTRRVHPLPLGVSDQNTCVSFNSFGSESSGITSTGNAEILCIRLDDVVPTREKIDFIKMDVEGAELSVLKGAEKVIHTNKPVLAISLYHNWDDLWTIPNYLQDTHKGYDFFIRQHMNNSFELVLYAVPR